MASRLENVKNRKLWWIAWEKCSQKTRECLIEYAKSEKENGMQNKHSDDELDWSAYTISTQQMKSVILFPFPSLARIFLILISHFLRYIMIQWCGSCLTFLSFIPKNKSKMFGWWHICPFRISYIYSHSGFHKHTLHTQTQTQTQTPTHTHICSLFKYHLLLH